MSSFLSATGGHAMDEPRAGDVALVGLPFDGAVTYRSGAAGGPAGVREASESIETYCPRLDLDLEDGHIIDLGDLPAPEVTDGRAVVESLGRALGDRIADGHMPLLGLGGDHLVALPLLRRAMARHPRLTVLHIDAHLDMREAWEDDPFNHATVIGRMLDEAPTHDCALRLVSWGIRSGTRTEFEAARGDSRISILGADVDARSALAAVAETDVPIYVTLDVDGIDPADIPGTGTPEPGGLPFRAVEEMLGSLRQLDVIGADIVELAPALDPTGRSAVACARLARTLLLVLRECARRRAAVLP
jgi:agmatinase